MMRMWMRMNGEGRECERDGPEERDHTGVEECSGRKRTKEQNHPSTLK